VAGWLAGADLTAGPDGSAAGAGSAAEAEPAGGAAVGHTVVVTHAAVVRAAVVVTLGAPPAGFWRIDVAPLTATVLRGGPRRWTVRGTALPIDPSPGER